MNKVEFTRQYCERSGITEAKLLTCRAVLPCYCDDSTRQGWAVIPLDLVEWHEETHGRKPDQQSSEQP